MKKILSFMLLSLLLVSQVNGSVIVNLGRALFKNGSEVFNKLTHEDKLSLVRTLKTIGFDADQVDPKTGLSEATKKELIKKIEEYNKKLTVPQGDRVYTIKSILNQNTINSTELRNLKNALESLTISNRNAANASCGTSGCYQAVTGTAAKNDLGFSIEPNRFTNDGMVKGRLGIPEGAKELEREISEMLPKSPYQLTGISKLDLDQLEAVWTLLNITLNKDKMPPHLRKLADSYKEYVSVAGVKAKPQITDGNHTMYMVFNENAEPAQVDAFDVILKELKLLESKNPKMSKRDVFDLWAKETAKGDPKKARELEQVIKCYFR